MSASPSRPPSTLLEDVTVTLNDAANVVRPAVNAVTPWISWGVAQATLSTAYAVGTLVEATPVATHLMYRGAASAARKTRRAAKYTKKCVAEYCYGGTTRMALTEATAREEKGREVKERAQTVESENRPISTPVVIENRLALIPAEKEEPPAEERKTSDVAEEQRAKENGKGIENEVEEENDEEKVEVAKSKDGGEEKEEEKEKEFNNATAFIDPQNVDQPSSSFALSPSSSAENLSSNGQPQAE